MESIIINRSAPRFFVPLVFLQGNTPEKPKVITEAVASPDVQQLTNIQDLLRTPESLASIQQIIEQWSAAQPPPEIPLRIQRIRVQTNSSGAYTWTFPTPYPSGVIPVVSAEIEGASGSVWSSQLSVTNTQLSIQLTRTTPVTVLSISVLGVSSNPQAYVHLMAISPV